MTSKRGERIIEPGQIWVIKGEGMPIRGRNKGARGDMYIRFEVEFPSVSWAKALDLSGDEASTTVGLPPKMLGLVPGPERVDERQLSLTPVKK